MVATNTHLNGSSKSCKVEGGSSLYRYRCFNFHVLQCHTSRPTDFVLKLEFEIRPDLGCTTIETSNKVVLTVRICVRLSVFLSLFTRTLTGVRVNRSSINLKGMFGYMGHCVVSIFVAIRQPVYEII